MFHEAESLVLAVVALLLALANVIRRRSGVTRLRRNAAVASAAGLILAARYVWDSHQPLDQVFVLGVAIIMIALGIEALKVRDGQQVSPVL